MNESIIVYRSQIEANADQYFQDNPEVMLGMLGIMFLTIILFQFRQKLRKIFL
jgi:hypothetical protein